MSPKFLVGDKIIFEMDSPNLIGRNRRSQVPIVYIVQQYDPIKLVYYVTIPQNNGYKVYAQYDLEMNFRVADPYEVDLYF
jgi:hypothetical protein